MPPRPMILIAALAALPTSVVAQDRGFESTRLIDQVAKCRTVVPDKDRLACFDDAATSLASAMDAGKLLILDRVKVAEHRRARFGLSMDIATPGQDDDEIAELRELTSTISSPGPTGYQRYNMALANGSVWQTVEPVRFPPRSGQAITIRSGALGSFNASIADKWMVKVKRVR